MQIVYPSASLEFAMKEVDLMKKIELAGRTCYKSEGNITENSCISFIRMILKNNHQSVLEHAAITARFICDRGVSHELVRHRIASYSQESQRYCNYGTGGNVVFVYPHWFDSGTMTEKDTWQETMEFCESQYIRLLEQGFSPQDARSVLPNSTKTEIVVTANLREWIHILKLRTHQSAHPDMRLLMGLFSNELKKNYPNLMRIVSEYF